MEHLKFKFPCPRTVQEGKAWIDVGVVASGNLEVMMERTSEEGFVEFIVDTAANGFANTWELVLKDFVDRSAVGGLKISINDNAASPSVVSLRLDQGLERLVEK